MTLHDLTVFLAWCSLINMVIILVWFLFFLLGHSFMYRVHSKLFKMSVEQFDAIHYVLIGAMKIVVIVFNLVPYLVLRCVMS